MARVAYDSSVRALDKQEHVPEESLLVVTLCAFSMSIGAAVFALLPRYGFVFDINGPAVYEGLYEIRDDPPESIVGLPTPSARSTNRTRICSGR